MRFLSLIPILFLSACTLGVSQQPSEEAKKEAEFQQLIFQSKSAEEKNKLKIIEADKKTSEIITKTSNQIVSLKNEVKQLKSELNEANQKLDSVIIPDANVEFKLLPIPNSKENR
jgi:outer membrane biogenesis lipoprotein LolB